MTNLEQFKKAAEATKTMVRLSNDLIKRVLLDLADEMVARSALILSANKKDLERMDESDPRYDRLKLTPERIENIAADMRSVADMKSPVGEILEERSMPSGLRLKKVSVPIGVVGVIYEARPNVTFDVFSLCFKSGNVSVLKGGQDAWNSNQAAVGIIRECLAAHAVSCDVVQLLPPDREAARELMHAEGLVDILIPRGSQGLIATVRQGAKIPVIETGAGIVHTYFDASGDLHKGKAIVFNAKTRRPAVCNALDCLIVHRDRLDDLPELMAAMAMKKVVIEADEPALERLKGHYPSELLQKANTESFGTEFLSLRMAIKTVKDLDEALTHINHYSSKHSEAIIAEDKNVIDRFLNEVDAAAVYANTSTAFTDGAQFGLGAEIGISTQKLHARGPMGLKELTSYKWIVESDGAIRP
ncbi:glutamate-5-semialdehyde dehydrogenase [Thermophagus xiamenensis]|uniref:Gamma-glutamyl phosphate reductase n=1 Tax=Thermophagus xiamenensis TaxID=385682 RepID=A0A1I1UHN8_9BACT|nr:glutamate-5-semialdehyde dehydrogenase [Thermophagus xiamenensis]SFD70376.1 glutamate-5-semialdehyde dehydrogenase [Thermophagus xiamenensis]